jgi:hypothetical protein
VSFIELGQTGVYCRRARLWLCCSVQLLHAVFEETYTLQWWFPLHRLWKANHFISTFTGTRLVGLGPLHALPQGHATALTSQMNIFGRLVRVVQSYTNSIGTVTPSWLFEEQDSKQMYRGRDQFFHLQTCLNEDLYKIRQMTNRLLHIPVPGLEDPEKMLEQTVNEMQADVIKMRQASAQVSVNVFQQASWIALSCGGSCYGTVVAFGRSGLCVDFVMLHGTDIAFSRSELCILIPC